MNLPNCLTILRVILAGCFVVFILRGDLTSTLMATVVFILAALTDYFDGYLAKKHHLITDFGKIMDPIADKFLVLAAFFIFARLHIIAGWMFYVILAREVIVTLSRLWAMRHGQVIAAEQAGKYKTVLQIGVILVILVYLMLAGAGMPPKNAYRFLLGIHVLMGLTVGLVLFSGFTYFWNNRKVFLSRLS